MPLATRGYLNWRIGKYRFSLLIGKAMQFGPYYGRGYASGANKLWRHWYFGRLVCEWAVGDLTRTGIKWYNPRKQVYRK